METRRGKKKGRSSKTPHNFTSAKNSNRRSTRRHPSFDEFDDDDERREKKVKLVVRLPQSDVGIGRRKMDSPTSDSSSASGSEELPEDNAEIREINDGSEDVGGDQEEKLIKEKDNSNGSPLESTGATPLPEKKLLVFILQRLQKKDTRRAFAEPVDPNELPDYLGIIEKPMDFATINKKLDAGAYKTLEEVEADVLLICSNAMEYNPKYSIYYRQARSIQELAKREFENLRNEGDDRQPQPKVVRRGRPPGKNQNKAPENPQTDSVVPEISSGATLANGDCKEIGSNSYNLRRPPPFASSHRRNGENYPELSINWNNEFPASILRADMKYNKKQLPVDENRRDTYGQFHPHALSNSKRLVPVGLQDPFAYARSLARYSADLAPLASKLASKKIESVLPAGKLATHSDFNSAIDGRNELLSVQPNHPHRNGFAGMFGHSSLSGWIQGYTQTEGMVSRNHQSTDHFREPDRAEAETEPGYQLGQSKFRPLQPLPIPADLNVHVPIVSTSSSIRIGSPQQPDLALQL